MWHRLLVTCLALAAIAWSNVYVVTSASNVGKYKRSGAAGSALRVGTARDASTDCMAAATDFATGTTATASLTCNHTGDIIVDMYSHADVTMAFTRVAGTAVKMQCDYSNNSGTNWQPILSEDSTGAKTPRTWTATTSATGRITNHFDIAYELLRCRATVTGGGATDKIAFHVQLAK